MAGFCVKKQPEMASYSLPFEQRIKDVLGWVGKLLGESLVPVSEDTKAVSAAFHSALMTGTRLCQVAQKLYPANALRFNAKPRSPASAIDNINLFLRTFQRSAAVGRPFVPMDLYNGTNLTSVLEYVFYYFCLLFFLLFF